MARRTKEDALATRASLLDAAERLFQANGVSGTSLNDIAQEAGTTRGAIYWHFRDKADLFNAMMERVTLPLEHAFEKAGGLRGEDAVATLRESIFFVFRKTMTDPQTRRVFEVATHKVEYVQGLGEVQARHLSVRNECVTQMKQALQQSARVRGLRLPVPAKAAAHGLHALIDGLIQNWLLDTRAFDLEKAGRQAIDAYLAGLGFGPA